jgi:hypothetical protein
MERNRIMHLLAAQQGHKGTKCNEPYFFTIVYLIRGLPNSVISSGTQVVIVILKKLCSFGSIN